MGGPGPRRPARGTLTGRTEVRKVSRSRKRPERVDSRFHPREQLHHRPELGKEAGHRTPELEQALSPGAAGLGGSRCLWTRRRRALPDSEAPGPLVLRADKRPVRLGATWRGSPHSPPRWPPSARPRGPRGGGGLSSGGLWRVTCPQAAPHLPTPADASPGPASTALRAPGFAAAARRDSQGAESWGWGVAGCRGLDASTPACRGVWSGL